VLLLPALPAAWPAGRLTGIRLRGGITADLRWADRKLVEASLRASREISRDIGYDGAVQKVSLNAGGEWRWRP